MEMPIYYNLSDFKESYLIDFPKWDVSNYLEYLDLLHDEYEKLALAVDDEEKYIFEYFPYDDIFMNIEIDQNLMNVFLIQNPDIDGNISIGQQFLQLMDIDKNFVYQFLGMNFYKILQFVDNERIKISLTTNETDAPEPEPYTEKERGVNVPYKIALLDEMGVIERLNQQFPNKSDIHRMLKFLTGGNLDNVKDYYNSIYGNYSGSNQITDRHREKAKQIYYK